MTVVDYKGYRVATQSIIPGILEREQEDSVVYGIVMIFLVLQYDQNF